MPFTVRPSDAPELSEGDPHVVALENARRKRQAADVRPGEHVLAVDTLVALDGAIYGKPADARGGARDAARAVGAHPPGDLGPRGRRPRHGGGHARHLPRIDDGAADRYVATGEWRDRAGGYAIQGRGAALVRAIEGDYLNVVGLPVAALLDLMESSDFSP